MTDLSDELERLKEQGRGFGRGLPVEEIKNTLRDPSRRNYHLWWNLNTFVFAQRAWCRQGERALKMPDFEINERLEWLLLGFFDKYPEFNEYESRITLETTPVVSEYLHFADEMRHKLRDVYVRLIQERENSSGEVVGDIRDELENLAIHSRRLTTPFPYKDAGRVKRATGASEFIIPDLDTVVGYVEPWCEQAKEAIDTSTDELNKRLKLLNKSFFEKFPELQEQERWITPEFTPKLFWYLAFMDRMRRRLIDVYLRILHERQLSEQVRE